MKRLNRTDELLIKLADGNISEAEDKELFKLTTKDSVEGYLSIIDLEDELSQVDSTLPTDFDAKVFSEVSERAFEAKGLRQAFYGSFKNTFIGLAALILVIGPSHIISSISRTLPGSSQVALANSFQTENIVANQQAPIVNARNEVSVLIELVDGATKQREFVTAVLRVNSKSPGQASLLLPKYEASVLKEYEKRVAL